MASSATPTNIPPISVSVPEAGRIIGVGRTKIGELIRNGDLKPVKLGRRTLLRVSDLEDFMERQAAA